jgi:Fe-S cluster assembly protein SufD
MVMATEVTKQESTFWEAIYSQPNEFATVGWAKRLREAAFDQFKELGFPTVKDEEWKYTNVAPLTKLSFQTARDESDSSVTAANVNQLGVVEAKNSQLVFVNGVLRRDLSSLADVPAGVIAIGLDEAIKEPAYEEVIREYLGRGVGYNTNGFVALNTAMLASGAFILIPGNVEVHQPLSLLFLSAGNVASFPRVLVIAEANSKATLVENYANAGVGVSFTNAVVEVVLQDGARLEHYKVQRENVESFHIASTSATLGTNASYDSTAINFGAQLSRHDVAVRMDHEGAECWVDGLYVVSSGQHTDTHSVIDHQQPHCTSHQLYKGILDGKSRAVFNGKVFVRHGAQKTDAMQTNKNLLLSKEARVDTKPQLEILADDVKCAHGAAVGQIDEDELFYLQTRGIHGELARNLLTYGFAEEVIGKIKIDSIRSQLDEAVLHRLNARLEA